MNRNYNLKLDLQFRCNNQTMKFNQTTKDFLQFVRRAPTAFQAVDEIASLLKKDGFQKISLQHNARTRQMLSELLRKYMAGLKNVTISADVNPQNL